MHIGVRAAEGRPKALAHPTSPGGVIHALPSYRRNALKGARQTGQLVLSSCLRQEKQRLVCLQGSSVVDESSTKHTTHSWAPEFSNP